MLRKIVLKIEADDTKKRSRATRTLAVIAGVESISWNPEGKTLTVIGDGIDTIELVKKLRKICYTELLSVGPAKEPDKETDLWRDNIVKNNYYEIYTPNVPDSSSTNISLPIPNFANILKSIGLASLFSGFKTKLLGSTSEPISVENLDLPETSRLTEEGPIELNDLESPTKFPASEDTSSAATQDKLEVRLDFLKVDGTLFDISELPSSFFEMRPALKVLDMSHTNIKTLPNWVYQLTELEELILRHCELLIELPHEVSKLGNLKVLDLEGTDLVCLPEELKELNNLKCLKFTLYDADSYRKSKNIAAIIPRGTLSKLTQLEELSINVDPQDVWCGAAMEAVMEDLPSLINLKFLKLYLPTTKLLQDLLELKGKNGMPIYQNLSDFNFIIGPRAQHFISRLPCDLEKEFLKLKKCLKYINGEDSTLTLAEALKHANALYLDRHWTLQKLSVFKFEELTKLKFCLLVDCNEMQTLFDGSDFNLGVANNEDRPHPLQYLAIHYLRKLEVIWKGPGVGCCLHSLKLLVVNTCPNLTTIFTPVLLRELVNLSEIQIENCPKITTLIAEDQSHLTSKGVLPRLQKLSLLYLPELVSIFNDLSIVPELENMVIYDCPKLEKLPSVVGCNNEVIQVKGESEWWDALRWNKSERSEAQPYYPLAFSDSDIDEDFPQQCGNSLRHLVEECNSSLPS
ncbi:hypothetical protein ACET3Z_013565 [Daucus carota]